MSNTEKNQNSSKKGRIGHSISQRFNRAKEWLLQSIGKSEKTEDAEFDYYFKKYNAHQCSVIKYQKHIKHYYHQIKDIQVTSHEMLEAIWELFDPIWSCNDDINLKLESLTELFRKHVQYMESCVVAPINSYVTKLAHMSDKIVKRNRKKLDYDASKHTLEKLQNAKKRKPNKIDKQLKLVDECQKQLQDTNVTITPQLRYLCDTTADHVSQYLKSFFEEQIRYHSEIARILTEVERDIQHLSVRTRSANSSQTSEYSSADDVDSQLKKNS